MEVLAADLNVFLFDIFSHLLFVEGLTDLDMVFESNLLKFLKKISNTP